MKLDETAYLLSSPANARRLRAAMRDIKAGRVHVFNSIAEMQSAVRKIKKRNKKRKKLGSRSV